MGDDQRESVRLWRAEVQEGVPLHDVLVVAFGEAPSAHVRVSVPALTFLTTEARPLSEALPQPGTPVIIERRRTSDVQRRS